MRARVQWQPLVAFVGKRWVRVPQNLILKMLSYVDVLEGEAFLQAAALPESLLRKRQQHFRALDKLLAEVLQEVRHFRAEVRAGLMAVSL